MANANISELFHWYKEYQAELLAKHQGRFLVITADGVYADYASDERAFFAVTGILKTGSFVILRCSQGDTDTTARFSSRVAFRQA